jgi:integrase
LSIFSEPLKHGKRTGDGIELLTTYPHVDLIVDQWNKAEDGKKVWDVSRWKMKNMFNEIGIYPHAFRFSRATRYAHDPDMSMADLMEWFGWARATTADSYIVPVRSLAKSLRSIEKELKG